MIVSKDGCVNLTLGFSFSDEPSASTQEDLHHDKCGQFPFRTATLRPSHQI